MNHFEKWRNFVSKDLGIVGCILAASILFSPQSALAGALSWAIGLSFYKLSRNVMLKTLPLYCHINLIAAGFLLSLDQPLSWQSLILVIVGAVATVILIAIAARIFYYSGIHVLLFPALVTYLICGRFADQNASWELLNVQFAQDSTWMIAAAVSLIFSPFFFAMFAVGAGFGALCQFAFMGLSSELNLDLFVKGLVFALSSCVFATPSKKSLLWSSFATVVVTFALQEIESVTGLLLVCHAACALAIFGSRWFGKMAFYSQKLLPEDKMDEQFTQWQRFRTGESRVGLPFKGTWKVSQSFDDEWTHQGIWQHGIDFVVCDTQGKSFRGEGYELSDYYAFGQEVLAPTSGYVVAMFHDFPDNPVGSVKNQNNFGNYIVIRDAYGAHVLLGHLKHGSITCALYQYVDVNQVIAQCGNSGYSPEPHIHMHVQADPIVGSATIPFHITNYLILKHFHFHGVPKRDEYVTQLEINTSLSRSLGFRINEQIQITSSGTATQIENKLDPYWGTMYFTDGQSKLFHYRDQLSFYFYRYEGRKAGPLYDLMSALPRVPLIYGLTCQFEDSPPTMKWRSLWHRWFAFLQMIVTEKCQTAKTLFEMNCDILEVKGKTWSGENGTMTSCFLDPVDGVVEFSVGERKYEVRSRRESVGVIGSSSVQQCSSEKLKRIV